jgi:hypothetical protein
MKDESEVGGLGAGREVGGVEVGVEGVAGAGVGGEDREGAAAGESGEDVAGGLGADAEVEGAEVGLELLGRHGRS